MHLESSHSRETVVSGLGFRSHAQSSAVMAAMCSLQIDRAAACGRWSIRQLSPPLSQRVRSNTGRLPV